MRQALFLLSVVLMATGLLGLILAARRLWTSAGDTAGATQVHKALVDRDAEDVPLPVEASDAVQQAIESARAVGLKQAPTFPVKDAPVKLVVHPARPLEQPQGLLRALRAARERESALPPAPQPAPTATAVVLTSGKERAGKSQTAVSPIPTAVQPAPLSQSAPTQPAVEYAGIDSWELLQRLATSDAPTQAILRSELTARGFTPREMAVGLALLDPDVTARKRLVEGLTGMPGLDPLRWLWQATRDPHPDVRLTALSLLATSSDPRLIEQVARAAGDDGDPRIQRLAQQIGTWRTTLR